MFFPLQGTFSFQEQFVNCFVFLPNPWGIRSTLAQSISSDLKIETGRFPQRSGTTLSSREEFQLQLGEPDGISPFLGLIPIHPLEIPTPSRYQNQIATLMWWSLYIKQLHFWRGMICLESYTRWWFPIIFHVSPLPGGFLQMLVLSSMICSIGLIGFQNSTAHPQLTSSPNLRRDFPAGFRSQIGLAVLLSRRCFFFRHHSWDN